VAKELVAANQKGFLIEKMYSKKDVEKMVQILKYNTPP